MPTFLRRLTLAALVIALSGCMDMDLTNPNEPDRARALSDPERLETHLSGGWVDWWLTTQSYHMAHAMLSAMSFQHSTWAAFSGTVYYSSIPRVSTRNDPAHAWYSAFGLPYTHLYRSIAAANDALRVLAPVGSVELTGSGPDRNRHDRARAFARYVQGISYGYLALMFTEGPVVDETTDLEAGVEFVGYPELMDVALGYLDEASAIASASDFEVPTSWIPTPTNLTSAELARVASSYKARLRAAVARTPLERAALDWQQVLREIDAGITSGFAYDHDNPWPLYNFVLLYTLYYQWSQMPYWVFGMADQSDQYQEWMGLPTSQKHPILANGPFLINTPDLRFPQGATVEEQIADGAARADELRFCVTSPGCPHETATVYAQWAGAGRGTWRWSYYRDRRDPTHTAHEATVPDISMHEMRLLAAEAHYRLGNPARAAELANETRTAAGLNATDATGTNTSCVPRLPNRTCGDLMEMIKWEKRMLAAHNNGFMGAMMYFEGRGWGDLMEGTILSWPVPARVAELESRPIERAGGGSRWSAPVGTYGY